MPVSTIQLTFEGMLVLFAQEGATVADAGLLKTAHKHDAKLLITEIPQGGKPKPLVRLEGANVNKRYELKVQKNNLPPITLYTNLQDFHRKSHQDFADFRWVLNYVSDEMYQPPVVHDKGEFRAFLRMNTGTFFTQEISKNELVLVRPSGRETIGRVAVKIRAEIQLVDNDKAIFSKGNGDELELTAKDNTNYELYFGLVRPPNAHDHDIDAKNYHAALPVNKLPEEKIDFDRPTDRIFLTPDAACFSPTNPPPGY